MQQVNILKGNIIYAEKMGELKIFDQSYLISEDNCIQGVFSVLPERYKGYEVRDYGDKLIIPGLIDLHVHAPQYTFRGVGMDLELLDWLKIHTFPAEARYSDLNYARETYQIFVDNMKHSATTRACIFATIHRSATLLLMDLFEQSGMAVMVGKVNMDRNAPEYLCEATSIDAAEETVEWIKDVLHKKYNRVLPILTPRFIPSCTDDLMERLKMIQIRYDLPVQSHLSENQSEIEWVKELCPDAVFYGDAYDRFGLFGADCQTVMAHCVYSSDEEIQRIKENGVFIAHCPESNENLASGIAPIRKYLDMGIHVGLGSDIAGGTTENLFRAMAHAIQVSKMKWRISDQQLKPLSVEEVFYMATKGGGTFFGKVGSFEEGYEMDAVVLDDSRIRHNQKLTTRERLERIIYCADDREIAAKYVKGDSILG